MTLTRPSQFPPSYLLVSNHLTLLFIYIALRDEDELGKFSLHGGEIMLNKGLVSLDFLDVKNPRKLERKLDHIYIGDMKLFIDVPEYGKTSNKKLGGERQN
ncbi:hypothetical protein CR513_19567, partial [Mucuna pruriens]